MKADDCAEMRLLIQADVDGELTPADAAAVGRDCALSGCHLPAVDRDRSAVGLLESCDQAQQRGLAAT